MQLKWLFYYICI